MECFYFFSVTALQLCTRSYFPTGWQLPCGQLVKTPELFFITFHDWNSLTPVPKTPGQSKVVATAAWRWGWASVGVGVDLPSAGLQVLCWPSVKTEGRAQRQQQSHQWFNGWGSLRVWSQVLEWHPVCAGGRTWGQSLLPEGREDCQLYEDVSYMMSGWLMDYQGNWKRGMPSTTSLIRTITSSAWGKCAERSFLWVGCRWSRHW